MSGRHKWPPPFKRDARYAFCCGFIVGSGVAVALVFVRLLYLTSVRFM